MWLKWKILKVSLVLERVELIYLDLTKLSVVIEACRRKFCTHDEIRLRNVMQLQKPTNYGNICK